MVKNNSDSGGAAKSKDSKKMRPETLGDAPNVSRPRVEPRVQNEIGKHLRAIYDDVVNEPVPAKFMDLLEQLERSATRKS